MGIRRHNTCMRPGTELKRKRFSGPVFARTNGTRSGRVLPRRPKPTLTSLSSLDASHFSQIRPAVPAALGAHDVAGGRVRTPRVGGVRDVVIVFIKKNYGYGVIDGLKKNEKWLAIAQNYPRRPYLKSACVDTRGHVYLTTVQQDKTTMKQCTGSVCTKCLINKICTQ